MKKMRRKINQNQKVKGLKDGLIDYKLIFFYTLYYNYSQ